jgi:hypothetical protein
MAMSDNVPPELQGSLAATMVLGIINFLGYFLVVGFLGPFSWLLRGDSVMMVHVVPGFPLG